MMDTKTIQKIFEENLQKIKYKGIEYDIIIKELNTFIDTINESYEIELSDYEIELINTKTKEEKKIRFTVQEEIYYSELQKNNIKIDSY